MAIYKWARYSVISTKKWDTTKTASGKKSTLGAGVHACYAKNLTELGNMINVSDGKIHWNQEPVPEAGSPLSIPLRQYPV